MSLSRRDSPFASAGVVVQLQPVDWSVRAAAWGWDTLTGEPLPERPDDDPLFGVRLQLALQARAAGLGGGANRAPCQRTDLFVTGKGGGAGPLPSSYR